MNSDLSKVIVVGVDTSSTARKAAEKAAELARTMGAALHLVSAVKDIGLSTVSSGGDVWEIDDAGPIRDYLNKLAAEWPDLQVTTACGPGKPADVIVREAERQNAILIVVGNKRMIGVSRVLGAVAADVAHHAPCDVYIAYTTG